MFLCHLRNDAKPAMVCSADDLLGWKDFPKGLRALLLDEDLLSASEIKSKLEEMDYVGKEHASSLSPSQFWQQLSLDLDVSGRDESQQNLGSAETASDADLPGKGTSVMPMEIEANEETVEKYKLDASSCENGDGSAQRRKVDMERLQMQGKWRGVDPVVFFRDDTIINSIRTFYGVSESFPFDGHLVTRNSDIQLVKRIYYVSKSVHHVFELNFQREQQLKITSLGLKISVSVINFYFC